MRKRNCVDAEDGKISCANLGPSSTIISTATTAYAPSSNLGKSMIRSRAAWNRLRKRSNRSSFGCSFACSDSVFSNFIIQFESTGTRELESKYDAPIENPTASDKGTKSDCAGPVIKKEGRNTASTLSIANKRGIATSRLAARTACAFLSPCARGTWMFSRSEERRVGKE